MIYDLNPAPFRLLCDITERIHKRYLKLKVKVADAEKAWVGDEIAVYPFGKYGRQIQHDPIGNRAVSQNQTERWMWNHEATTTEIQATTTDNQHSCKMV